MARGGHDLRKLHAAFAAAKAHKGRPTAILAKTKNGFGMGGAGESRMIAHQAKKFDTEALYQFRERFNLPVTDEDVENMNIFTPDPNSEEMNYLRSRRESLGGYMPVRVPKAAARTIAKVPRLSRYAQPSLPEGRENDIVKGLNQIDNGDTKGASPAMVNLVGSGTILMEVIEAANILRTEFGITAKLFSATSFSELFRDAEEIERRNRFDPLDKPRLSTVQKTLGTELPVVVASDYVRAVPQMISQYLPQRFVAIGTDGFGRSDQRANLRAFFEVDRQNIALAAIEALVREGQVKVELHHQALKKFGLGAGVPAPWTV